MTPLDSTPADDAGPAVHTFEGWRYVLLWPLGLLVRWWGWSLRFEEDAEDLRNFRKRDEAVTMVLWHNRLFLSGEIFRRYRRPKPMYALVSASKDGAWLTAFYSLMGMRAVRGSSHAFGREAANAVVKVLQAGHDVGITPDGPRGPAYEFKPGALIMARRTQTPLLLIGVEYRSAWRFRKAWDQFYLPKPFSRVRMRCELVTAEEMTDRDAAAVRLQTRLRELNPDPDWKRAED